MPLAAAGADVSAKIKEGLTPRALAGQERKHEAAALLFELEQGRAKIGRAVKGALAAVHGPEGCLLTLWPVTTRYSDCEALHCLP
jgi:hypothetical protein